MLLLICGCILLFITIELPQAVASNKTSSDTNNKYAHFKVSAKKKCYSSKKSFAKKNGEQHIRHKLIAFVVQMNSIVRKDS